MQRQSRAEQQQTLHSAPRRSTIPSAADAKCTLARPRALCRRISIAPSVCDVSHATSTQQRCADDGSAARRGPSSAARRGELTVNAGAPARRITNRRPQQNAMRQGGKQEEHRETAKGALTARVALCAAERQPTTFPPRPLCLSTQQQQAERNKQTQPFSKLYIRIISSRPQPG